MPDSARRSKFRFFRAGGLNQLLIERGEDLVLIKDLDQRLWLSLSCPVKGLEADEETLKLIDTDKDGRIRVPEMIAAVEWTLKMLKSPSLLPERKDTLELEQINDSHAEGARLKAAAERILYNLGRAGQKTISLAESRDTAKIFAATSTNGDGIIPVQATTDPDIKLLILDIFASIGSEQDRSGEPGVSETGVKRFFEALRRYRDWWAFGYEVSEDKEMSLHNPQLEAAHLAIQAVREKVDNYFTQCRLTAFDPRAADPLNFSPSDLQEFKSATSEAILEKLKAFPLARVTATAELPLTQSVNPAWKAPMDTLNKTAIKLVFGEEKESLSLEEWEKVKRTLKPFRDWYQAKAGSEVEKLGINRIRQILQSEVEKGIMKLIQEDREVAEEIASIVNVEKLLRFHRDLFMIVNNFVAFPYFYDLRKRAIFQTGALYMDGRCFHLCVSVDDRAKHQPLATLSGTFLMYCQLNRVGSSQQRTVVTAVTAGDAQRLKVGKNGIFYDRQGLDWDATVIQIVVNPISLREAVFSPFKRLGQLITEQVEKISTAREKAIQTSVQQSVTDLDKTVASVPTNPAIVETAPPPAHSSGPGVGGLIAGGGVAIAAISSSFTFISGRIGDINPVHFFYTAIIFLLLVLVPSFIVALLKLRARDLGQVLEAGGWAINGHMRISGPLGRLLTQRKQLPPGAKSETLENWRKPAWKRPSWWWVAAGAIVAAILWFTFQ